MQEGHRMSRDAPDPNAMNALADELIERALLTFAGDPEAVAASGRHLDMESVQVISGIQEPLALVGLVSLFAAMYASLWIESMEREGIDPLVGWQHRKAQRRAESGGPPR
jgi:hypothetical protein